MIHSVAFLAILIINHRVVEVVNVAAGFPGGGVHKNGGINTNNVFMQLGHALPPVVFNIFLQFTAVLAIIIYGAESVINFAALEYKTVFFAVPNNCLEPVCIVCHNGCKYKLIS